MTMLLRGLECLRSPDVAPNGRVAEAIGPLTSKR